jgi:hypothetical protein
MKEDDVLEMSDAVDGIANAITGRDLDLGSDETGGTIGCLTEAVMGITAGLCRVASAISELAEAVREKP